MEDSSHRDREPVLCGKCSLAMYSKCSILYSFDKDDYQSYMIMLITQKIEAVC